MPQTKKEFSMKKKLSVIPAKTLTYKGKTWVYFQTVGTSEEAEKITKQKQEEGYSIKKRRMKKSGIGTLFIFLYQRKINNQKKNR